MSAQAEVPHSPQEHLEHFRRRAKELLKAFRAGQPEALRRIREHLPRRERGGAGDTPALKLTDAQLVIAREQGFPTWPKLRADLLARMERSPGQQSFLKARDALDAGDVAALRKWLKAYPALVRARSEEAEGHYAGYFKGATLLHHTAGNPIRGPVPENVVEVIATLLRAGAEADAPTDCGAWSWTTLGLVASGMQALSQGLMEPIAEALVAAGADVNWNNGINLYGALYHSVEYARMPEAAEWLYRRGATVDLGFAAGLGDVERMKDFLKARKLAPDTYSKYRSSPMKKPTDAQVLAEALLMAVVNDRLEAATFLLNYGAKINEPAPFGQERPAPLHAAIWADRRAMAELLIQQGADLNLRDKRHRSSPLGWARFLKKKELAERLEALGAAP